MEILKMSRKEHLPKVVVLGNLDGIHKGHLMLIDQAKRIAKKHHLPSALFTFNPHPSFLLTGKNPVDLIYTPYEKEKVFEQTGIDLLIQYPFSKEVANLTPEIFIQEIILEDVRAHTVVVGEDYRFGKKREGDVKLLRKLGEEYGFDVCVLEKVKYQGKEISSTWIRELVRDGNIEMVNHLLGRCFSFIGKVVSGKKIGRTIGYPTANIIPDKNKILPPHGVYISKVLVDEKYYNGITNIGFKPTVNGKELTIETYILNFEAFIYEKEIQVDLYHFLRPEKKLSGLEELKSQINEDLQNLKNYFFK